jgi:CBS domain-containing membrane protein
VSNMLKVETVMSTDLITLNEDETLDLVEQVMRLGRVRHLPVTRGSELVGLVTHRDLLRASISALADIGEDERQEMMSRVQVRDIMNVDVKTVTPELPLMQAAAILLQNRYGCLPVVNSRGVLDGILTEADFLRYSMVLLKKIEDLEAALD